MLYFPRIIELNAVICLNLIEKLNILNLKIVFKFYLKKDAIIAHGYIITTRCENVYVHRLIRIHFAFVKPS